MKLLIGIPSLDFMHTDFVKSLTALTVRLKDDGIDFDVEIMSGTLVYFARDNIACKAINGGYTHVLWLDSDMVFTDDILDDLAFSGKQFVSGIYHARRKGHQSCIFKSIDIEKGIERFETYPTDTFRIAGCGFGCVLTDVEILRAVQTQEGTCFTPIKLYGEDLAFCLRASRLGYKIWCEPSVVCGHIGHLTVYPEDYEIWKSRISNIDEFQKEG